ncbi:MAG: class I SAM-dependent methyltransferase [bacterium]|nr:class I SAM-dependent methyltransferase [bacterium]
MAQSFSLRIQEARKFERWMCVYREQPGLFRLFEKAEDPEGLAAQRLAHLAELEGKRVLEIGCGTGWLTRRVASLAAHYKAVEPSAFMLAEAGDLHPAHALRASGQELPFADGSFDRIVMSWVLLDLRPSVRALVLEECLRVLKPNSADRGAGIWLIENAATGEFQALRGLLDPGGHGELAPLIEEFGFSPVEMVATQIRFQGEREAAQVLGAILGSRVADHLQRQPRVDLGMDLSILFRPNASGG